MSSIIVIGSGFSGLASATVLASKGHSVRLFEKNNTIGGRARSYSEQGFMFDMGPSWYWMPDTFENYFALFNKKPSDYYDLIQLDPGFRIFFSDSFHLDVSASRESLNETFESIEKGSSKKLEKFLKESGYKYRLGMQHLVYTPANSWFEFMHPSLISGIIKTKTLSSVRTYVKSYFKDPRLIALMEFPVLFLGAMPQHIPSLYTLMNYAAIELGTWYPMGGMRRIIDGMEKLAKEMGVQIETNQNVEHINVENGRVVSVNANQQIHTTDGVIASADYHHVDQQLLDPQFRNYTEGYWDKRILAPSCIIFYLGINKKISGLLHHNLFFDTDFEQHADDIYDNPKWPEKPLFYVCCPSKTDSTVAPLGMENLFILIPVATGLNEANRNPEQYLDAVISRIELKTGESILPNIIYKKSYTIKDFTNDYNAYKGNAYGLANTLTQTAVWKPALRNKKLPNLFYTGQLTVPGPGVPPSLISGQLAAYELHKSLKST